MPSPFNSTMSLRHHQFGWPHATDLRGGLSAALMTLVTAVSYAAVAGAPLGASMSGGAVLSGLIGAVVGGAVAALLNSVPGLVFSPRASVAVVIASALSTAGATLSGLALVGWLSVCLALSALAQMTFAWMRLGAVIRLIPHSVTAGFTVGIALKMIWSQLPFLLGPAGTQGLPWVAPFLIGTATVGAIAWAQWKKRLTWALPGGVMVGIATHSVLTTFAPAAANLPHLQALDLHSAPIVSMTALASTLFSSNGMAYWPSLIGFALVIAFVNSIETLTSTIIAEDLAQTRYDANSALLAGALGSIAAVVTGGLPVAASSATSLANIKAGGTTRHATLLAAIGTGLLAVLLSRALPMVPLAVVAGLMLTIAFALLREPVRDLLAEQRSISGARGFAAIKSGDFAVAALVCALLLTTGIVTAVIAGVMAAAALLTRQMRNTLVRRQYDATHPDAISQIDFEFETRLAQRIQVIEVAQPMFFATAEAVVDILERLKRGTRFAILDLSHVGAIDATAKKVLSRCRSSLRSRNRELLLVTGPGFMGFDSRAKSVNSKILFSNVGDALRFAAHQCTDEFRDSCPVLTDPVTPEPWSRRLQLMVVSLRDSRRLHDGIPEIHTPLDPKAVELAGSQLAVFVGPIGKLLARRAAPKCADIAALYRTLGQELHIIAEREAFLRQQPTDTAPSASVVNLERRNGLSLAPVSAPIGVSLAAPVLEQATRDLTLYLGPIASLLVKRAQAKALDREHLYHLLARHVSKTSDRYAFLAAAGLVGALDRSA